jgi:hypothetical protein
MVLFLYCIAAMAYALAVFAFAISLGTAPGMTFGEGGSDIQMILAGIYGTMGTVALAGGGIIQAINTQIVPTK